MARWPGGHGPPNCFKVVRFSKILMFHQKIFRLLLLVKVEVLNFIGKSLNMAPLLYRCHNTPLVQAPQRKAVREGAKYMFEV